MLRVLHVLPKFSPRHWAGAEASVAAIAQPLRREFGFESSVISLALPGDPVTEIVESLEVRRFQPSKLLRPGLDRQLKGSGALSIAAFLFVARSGADILHLHTHNRFTTEIAHAARLVGKPYVLSVHSLYLPDQRPLLGRSPVSAEWTFRHAQRILCVSERDFLGLRKRFGPSVVRYVPNGVSAAFERGDGSAWRTSLGASDDQILLTHIGRICELKNQRYSIELLPLIERVAERPTYLLIAGDASEPEYASELKARCRANDLLRDRVRFLGPLPTRDLPNLYAAADFVMLPSTHEAQPLVLNEAWASRTPVGVLAAGGLAGLIGTSGPGAILDEPDSAAVQVVQIVQQSRAGGLERLWASHAIRYWSDVADQIGLIYREVMRR
jgi:glycosyltransferase involved in cell wall biosynthesis